MYETDYFHRVAQQHPSTYDGNPDPRILENRLREFETLFTVVRCPEKLKVDIASSYLKDQADMWWSHHHTVVLENTEYNWDRFTQDIRNKFYPLYLKKRKIHEFATLVMVNLTVEEYYQKFLKLLRFAPTLVPSEEHRIQKFEQGLTIE